MDGLGSGMLTSGGGHRGPCADSPYDVLGRSSELFLQPRLQHTADGAGAGPQ